SSRATPRSGSARHTSLLRQPAAAALLVLVLPALLLLLLLLGGLGLGPGQGHLRRGGDLQLPLLLPGLDPGAPAVAGEHPGVLGAAAAAGVDDELALAERHPRQAAGQDPDLLAV